jgi:hypothetical protein
MNFHTLSRFLLSNFAAVPQSGTLQSVRYILPRDILPPTTA